MMDKNIHHLMSLADHYANEAGKNNEYDNRSIVAIARSDLMRAMQEALPSSRVTLSEKLQRDHESGDFGKALEGYAAEAKALEEELEVSNQLLNHRQELLNAIPPCPTHGHGCVPHALDWITKHKEQA
jgi:hypothetical protein